MEIGKLQANACFYPPPPFTLHHIIVNTNFEASQYSRLWYISSAEVVICLTKTSEKIRLIIDPKI